VKEDDPIPEEVLSTRYPDEHAGEDGHVTTACWLLKALAVWTAIAAFAGIVVGRFLARSGGQFERLQPEKLVTESEEPQ
jgi:hypothetical protein